MNSTKFYDIMVAKDYETRKSGEVEKKTAWNKVGRAWASKSSESLSFELYLFPNQRYVIHLRDREQNEGIKSENAAE